MRFFLPVKDCIGRGLTRKKTLIAFAVLFLAGIVFGIVFLKTPAVYDYHLDRCNKYLEGVLYSGDNVLLILLKRTAGHAFLLAVLVIAGIHPAALVITPCVVAYRAYTFGGSMGIFVSVFRLSGALVIFPVYLPVRLLMDAIFLLAIATSFERASGFCFNRGCWKELACDFLVYFVLVLLVCILEMILLLIFFRPIGNIA